MRTNEEIIQTFGMATFRLLVKDLFEKIEQIEMEKIETGDIENARIRYKQLKKRYGVD